MRVEVNDKLQMKYFLLALLAIFSVASAAQNVITITETEGVAQSNYPLRFASPFLPGEIFPYPLVLVDGSAVPSQADVKQRYPDGSVKHAILSILVPSISANGTVKLTFTSQQSAHNTALSKDAMLDAKFNFDATMELTLSSTVTASARTMLQNGDYTVWAGGDIATTIILADHTASRKYDLGFDTYKSFRPIFHATFWPAINMVHIRFIGEVSNSEALQDMNVTNLVLKTGSSSPQIVYTLPSSNSPLCMFAGSRWTKQAWIGSQTITSKLNIYHDLDYVKSTRFVFNFDTSKVIPESIQQSEYASWLSADRDLYGNGKWTKYMPTTGGRADIGPYPNWVVSWLFTGDWRNREVAFGQADLAAAWPAHYREGNVDKRFLRNDTVNGTALGRVLSSTDRPTMTGSMWTYLYTNPSDRITIVGPLALNQWVIDQSHCSDPFSAVYALSGDFFYLEQLWFWASWNQLDSNGAASIYSYGRGPTGAEGGLSSQLRGMAWTLRTRVHTVYMSPDDTMEKEYFKQLTIDAIAIEDGARNFTNSPYYGTPCWNWGLLRRSSDYLASATVTLPALNQWGPGSSAFVQADYGVNLTTVSSALSLFEQNYMMLSIGRAKELGFEADLLRDYLGQFYVKSLSNTNINRNFIANGRVPTIRKSDNTYFQTFEDMLNGYTSEWQQMAVMPALDDSTGGMPYIALAAVSMVGRLSEQGQQAWQFMADNVLTNKVLDANPKWAIIPRTEDAIPNQPLSAQPYYLPPTGDNNVPSTPVSNTPNNVSTSNVIHASFALLSFAVLLAL